MKIPTLYHGSAADIETFIPRDGINNALGKYKGILCTELKDRAMLYALKIKEGFDPHNVQTALGGAKDELGVDSKDFMITNHTINGVPCAIFRDREKYLSELIKVGGGGKIYTLPNESFAAVTRDDGVATNEWLSNEASLQPIAKEFVSFEEAMKRGGQILFLKDGMDFNDFKRIFEPRQQEMMGGNAHVNLYKEMISQGILFDENARRGIPNPLDLSTPIRTTQAAPLWSEMPRNLQGYRHGVTSMEMNRL